MKKIAILLVLVAVCFSQEFNEGDPRAIIEKVKIYRLTQELELTTDQADKFFPKFHELQNIEKEFGKEKMRILSELKKMVSEDVAEKEIIIVVSKYKDAQRKKAEEQTRKLEEVWRVLTPVQRAKYLIFQEEFNREIREMIKEIKKHRHSRP